MNQDDLSWLIANVTVGTLRKISHDLLLAGREGSDEFIRVQQAIKAHAQVEKIQPWVPPPKDSYVAKLAPFHYRVVWKGEMLKIIHKSYKTADKRLIQLSRKEPRT